MRTVPFARFHALMSTMAALMAAGAPTRDHALHQAGGYKSRGKGKGRGQASGRFVAQAKRAAIKAANRAKHRRACRG